MELLKVLVCVLVDDLITMDVSSYTTVQQLMRQILHSAENSSTATTTKNFIARIRDCGDKDCLLLLRGRNLLDAPSSTLEEIGVADEDHMILSRKGLLDLHIRTLPPMTDLESTPVEALQLQSMTDLKPIQVDPLEQVIQLKEKIKIQTGVPESEQHLYYSYNLMRDDHRPLAYYGIFNRRDTGTPDPSDQFRYLVFLGFGPFKERLPHYFASLVSKYCQSSSSEFTIIVECTACLGSIRLRLAVKGNDTIENLKSKICAKVRNDEGRTPLGYILEDLYMLMYNRKELEDGSLSLDECGIKDGDKIHLCPKAGFFITVILVLEDVPPKKKVYGVDVRCSETVGTLKAKIRDREGISPEKQILLRFEKKWLVNDQSCLLEYGIVELPPTRHYKNYYLHRGHNCIVEALTYG